MFQITQNQQNEIAPTNEILLLYHSPPYCNRGVVRSRSERDAGGFEGGAVLSIVKQDINSKEQILAQILANAESPVELLIRKSYKVTANTAFLTDHFEVINAEKRQWRELKFQEKLATRITELERFASEKVLEAQKTLKERNDKELLVTSIRKKAFMVSEKRL